MKLTGNIPNGGLVVAALLLAPSLLQADARVDYARQVKPLLKTRCYACHGALRQRSALRLDTADLIRTGGESGPAIEPGDSSASLLIQMVTGPTGDRMPPEGKPLSAEEIQLLSSWVEQGAVAPAIERPEADPRQHWSFRLPSRSPIPHAVSGSATNNPIDVFLDSERARRRLVAAPPAARHVLLRRVYLDLIGLPPSRNELQAFLADRAPNAYELVVDRLLASPQYGERWARHWMDVWRYSDWYGRRAVPDVLNSYAQIWRWRDWIVRSLNDDRGYDWMVVQMLAADEVAPEDDENLAATGFIVRSFFKWNYNTWMRDLTEHTSKSFLALTINCAQCHDHKYDPISQVEYFKFRAFFEPLQLRHDRVAGEPDPGPFVKYVPFNVTKPIASGRIRVFDEKLDARTYMVERGDERRRIAGAPPVKPAAPALLGGDRLRIVPVELPDAAYYPGLKRFIQREEIAAQSGQFRSAEQEFAKAQQLLTESELREQDSPQVLQDAQAAANAAAARRRWAAAALDSVRARIAADNAKFKGSGGDFEQLARAASRAESQLKLQEAEHKLIEAENALAAARRKSKSDAIRSAETRREKCLAEVKQARRAAAQAPTTQYARLSDVYPSRSTGRRSALAKWIASNRNPLTARVAVNHMWLRHFHSPLVETVFDFGRRGALPTHPQLLDWLAVELMESGWSMKRLHRLIVTSRAYRMSSRSGDAHPANVRIDADNQYLWRMNSRRMEAEVVRDSILHMSGRLDAKLHGPAIEQTREQTTRRRSLYISHHGEGRAPFLQLFDAADPVDCYRRSHSVTPQQALAMSNSQLSRTQSRLIARELSGEIASHGQPPGDQAFVRAAFEQILGRVPTDEEQQTCREFMKEQSELYRQSEVPRVEPKVAAGFVPPAAGATDRARENLVHVLLSHNDFVTIR